MAPGPAVDRDVFGRAVTGEDSDEGGRGKVDDRGHGAQERPG